MSNQFLTRRQYASHYIITPGSKTSNKKNNTKQILMIYIHFFDNYILIFHNHFQVRNTAMWYISDTANIQINDDATTTSSAKVPGIKKWTGLKCRETLQHILWYRSNAIINNKNTEKYAGNIFINEKVLQSRMNNNCIAYMNIIF
jgi:hypothetical protein